MCVVYIEVLWRGSPNPTQSLQCSSTFVQASMIHSSGWKPNGKHGSDHCWNYSWMCVCARAFVNVVVSLFVCVRSKYIYSWILSVCVSGLHLSVKRCAETELGAADSSVRWSDSLSGKFTLRVAVEYTVGWWRETEETVGSKTDEWDWEGASCIFLTLGRIYKKILYSRTTVFSSISLFFGSFVGQNKQFDDITFGSVNLWWAML